MREYWKVGDVFDSPQFALYAEGKESWVFAPKKDLSLKELDELRYPKDKAVAVDASVKDLKPKEVASDFHAVQLILEASASKQAEKLGEGVEVVYVHATEAGEIGRQGGALADLEQFRAASPEQRTFYLFGGKPPTFKSFWSVRECSLCLRFARDVLMTCSLRRRGRHYLTRRVQHRPKPRRPVLREGLRVAQALAGTARRLRVGACRVHPQVRTVLLPAIGPSKSR